VSDDDITSRRATDPRGELVGSLSSLAMAVLFAAVVILGKQAPLPVENVRKPRVGSIRARVDYPGDDNHQGAGRSRSQPHAVDRPTSVRDRLPLKPGRGSRQIRQRHDCLLAQAQSTVVDANRKVVFAGRQSSWNLE